MIANFQKLNSHWISISEFITFSRNQGVIRAKMDVSIPTLTKVVNKCSTQYLCLVILIEQKLHSSKMVFYTDQRLCRARLSQTQSHNTVQNCKKKRCKIKSSRWIRCSNSSEFQGSNPLDPDVSAHKPHSAQLPCKGWMTAWC